MSGKCKLVSLSKDKTKHDAFSNFQSVLKGHLHRHIRETKAANTDVTVRVSNPPCHTNLSGAKGHQDIAMAW